ncbi:MAG: MATE family efflux transporter [Candidatus Methanomethylicia archaeon]
MRYASRSRIDEYRDFVLRGSVITTLLKLGLPPMISNIVFTAYDVLNSIWLSLYSDVAIAVPRQVFPVAFLFNGIINAMSAAGTSLISQRVGAKMYGYVKKEFSRLFTATFIFAFFASTIFYVTRPFIFKYIVSTPEEIYGYVLDYSAFTSLHMVLMSVSMILGTVISSMGDTRSPSFISAIGVVVNTILDPFFILGIGFFPRLGVVGSVLTDIIGSLISVLGILYVLYRNFPEVTVSLTRDFSFQWFYLIIKIGGPIMLMSITNSLAFITQTRMVNEFGIIIATAFSIGSIFFRLADSALWGFSRSMSITVGQSLGAGYTKRAREIAIKGGLFTAAMVAFTSTILYITRWQIVLTFTSTYEIATEAVYYVNTILLGLPFFALFMSGDAVGRGSGQTIIPTIIGMARLWGIRIGFAYILAFHLGWGPQGIWIGMLVSNIVGGLLMIIWIFSGKWMKTVIPIEKKDEVGPDKE